MNLLKHLWCLNHNNLRDLVLSLGNSIGGYGRESWGRRGEWVTARVRESFKWGYWKGMRSVGSSRTISNPDPPTWVHLLWIQKMIRCVDSFRKQNPIKEGYDWLKVTCSECMETEEVRPENWSIDNHCQSTRLCKIPGIGVDLPCLASSTFGVLLSWIIWKPAIAWKWAIRNQYGMMNRELTVGLRSLSD
jgi:hypothetical protein